MLFRRGFSQAPVEIESVRQCVCCGEKPGDFQPTSSMAAPLNEVAATVPLPPAGATLSHGTAAGVGAIRLAVILGGTPEGSLDS